jgi:CHAD domain-containing protein
MKHQEIAAIIEKRFEKLNVAFESVRLHFTEEDIRVFRVKVKKLQACLRLMNAAKDQLQPLRLPSKIAKFYNVLGQIRSLQMLQRVIQKIGNDKHVALPETYLALIAAKLPQETTRAAKLVNGKSPLKKGEVKLSRLLPHRLSPKAIEKFIASEEEELEKLFAPVFITDQSFHAARKLLKNLLYLFPYIAMGIGALLPYALLTSQDSIDSFTSILGDFHDLNTSIAILQGECPTVEVNENEKTALRAIEELWVKERAVIRKKLYDQLQKIIASRRLQPSLVKWPVM